MGIFANICFCSQATDYLVNVIGAEYTTVLTSFALVSATAPVAGVIYGGWVVDKLGGYNGPRGMALTARYLTLVIVSCVSLVFLYATRAGFVNAVLSCALAIPCGRQTSFPVVMGMAWLVFFFGGATVPGATGMVLNAVDPSLRAFSSAMSMFVFNIFGYAAGTLVPSMYMQVVEGDPIQKLADGFRLVLWWSCISVFLMGILAWETTRQWKAHQKSEGETQSTITASPQLLNNAAFRGPVLGKTLKPGTRVKTSFGVGVVCQYRKDDGVYQLEIGNSKLFMHRSQFKVLAAKDASKSASKTSNKKRGIVNALKAVKSKNALKSVATGIGSIRQEQQRRFMDASAQEVKKPHTKVVV